MKEMDYEVLVKELEKDIDYHSRKLTTVLNQEIEDIKQELLLKIWKAKRKFNSRKSKMRTFFNNVMANHSKDLIKGAGRGKRIPDSIQDTIDADIENELSLHETIEDPRANFPNKIEANDFFDRVAKNLDGKAFMVFSYMRFEGLGSEQIAKKMCCTHRYVDKLIQSKIKPAMFSSRNGKIVV